MVKTYNDAAEKLSFLTKCPFDQKTCGSCKSIDLWTDITQVLYAPLSCRKAVTKYCAANPTKPMCDCWNPKKDVYNTTACRVLRDAFEEDEQDLCKKISDKDIDCIKMKYQLIEKNKVKDKTNKNKNKYDDAYTFEKVRVKYDEDGLTTAEKKRMKMATSGPKDMQLKDNHKASCPTQDKTSPPKQTQPLAEDKAITGLDADDLKFLDDINKQKPTSGFWDTFSRLLFG
jgi:hypothetical protein